MTIGRTLMSIGKLPSKTILNMEYSNIHHTTKDGISYTTRIHKDSNLIVARSVLLTNEDAQDVWDDMVIRLSRVAVENDLDCRVWASSRSSLISLKKFSSMQDCIDYVNIRFKNSYSFQLKGIFVRVISNNKKFFYLIKNDK